MASYLTYSPIDVNVFPPSYEAARSEFLSITEALKGKHNAYPCPGTTQDGKLLFTDALWLGSENAEKVFVLLAGTHGVEGLVGSAIEQDFLLLYANREIKLPEGTAFLIVHALTPWGYAWLRRCDEDGVWGG